MAFGWLSECSGEKTSCPRSARELSRNQSMLRLDIILQHNWLIEQWLLHIRVFFGGKMKRPCFDLFIRWLIKQITNTYRNHFSRSYKNCSNQYSMVCTTSKPTLSMVKLLQDSLDPLIHLHHLHLLHYLLQFHSLNDPKKKQFFYNERCYSSWFCLMWLFAVCPTVMVATLLLVVMLTWRWRPVVNGENITINKKVTVVACVASVSIWFRSKKIPRKGSFGFDRARN